MKTKLLLIPFLCIFISFGHTSIRAQQTTLGVSLRSGLTNAISPSSFSRGIKFYMNYGLRAEYDYGDRSGFRMSIHIQQKEAGTRVITFSQSTGSQQVGLVKTVTSYLHFPFEAYLGLGEKFQVISGFTINNYLKSSNYFNDEFVGTSRDAYINSFQLGASLGLDYLLFDQNYWDMKIGAYANTTFSDSGYLFWGLQLTTSFKFP